MVTIHVSLKENPHRIVIGDGILSDLGGTLARLRIGSDAVVITHSRVCRHHGGALLKGLKENGFTVKLLTVPEGERSKSAQSALGLLSEIAKYDVMKKVFVVAFGGGVIGDLAGFVAAVFKRGVPYVHVPTTLLAQIDSSIGGKVAIDLPVGKNLVGAFYQPRIVWADVRVLQTLDQRQIRSGLAEAVKYGVIKDEKLFNFIAKNYSEMLRRNPAAMKKLAAWCARIKTEVVLADEKETKGIRTILNFGHTLGHAVEAAGEFKSYCHGEAIALGMRLAAEISLQMGMFSPSEARRLNAVLTAIGLPEQIKKIRLNDILAMMRHDKKFLAGRNRFVLAERIGRVKVVEDIPLPVITKSVSKFMESAG